MPFGKWTGFNNGLRSSIVASCPGTIPHGTCDQLFWISDVAPTFCEAAGKKYNKEVFDGKSQWQNFLGKNRKVHEYAYGAFSNCNIIDNRKRIFPIRVIRDKKYSLIWSPNHKEYTSNTNLTEVYNKVTGVTDASKKGSMAGSWLDTVDGDPMKDALIKKLIKRPEWALYDRENDPHEMKNLVDDPKLADTRKRLQDELMKWLEKWGDTDPIKTEKGLVKK